MATPLSYTIARGDSQDELTRDVNEHIASGWRPFGNLVVMRWTADGGKEQWKWLQPLVTGESH